MTAGYLKNVSLIFAQKSKIGLKVKCRISGQLYKALKGVGVAHQITLEQVITFSGTLFSFQQQIVFDLCDTYNPHPPLTLS